MRGRPCPSVVMALALFLVAGLLGAGQTSAPPARIEAEPIPGQIDMLQETSIQLGGRPDEGGLQPSSYEWKILEGTGGELLRTDQPKAIFNAPEIEEEARLFVIQLTVHYGDLEPSTARLHVFVHREEPGEEKDENDTAWLDEFYEGAAAAEAASGKGRASEIGRDVLLQYGHSRSTGWGWGFGYGVGVGRGFGWGGFVSYPAYVPINLPPPGVSWTPGVGDWADPLPVGGGN